MEPCLVTEHSTRAGTQRSFFLAAGPEDGPLVVFVHGWPELAIRWRHQLPVFAGPRVPLDRAGPSGLRTLQRV